MNRHCAANRSAEPLARYASRLALDDPERAFIHAVLATLAALPVTDERTAALASPRGLEAT